jgi:hypothetical protein
MTTDETVALQGLLERYAVAHVLNEIADLSSDRAERIRTARGDKNVALALDRASVEIGQLAARIDV